MPDAAGERPGPQAVIDPAIAAGADMEAARRECPRTGAKRADIMRGAKAHAATAEVAHAHAAAAEAPHAHAAAPTEATHVHAAATATASKPRLGVGRDGNRQRCREQEGT